MKRQITQAILERAGYRLKAIYAKLRIVLQAKFKE